MKKLLLSLAFVPLCACATGVSVVENHHGKWDVYYTSPAGKQFFIYEDADQMDAKSIDGGSLFYKTEGTVFWIFFPCYQHTSDSCLRYVNLTTNQISRVIERPALMVKGANSALVGPIDNLKENVVLTFNYPSDWQYTVTSIFQPCKHPFVYPLQHLSDGPDVGTAFLSNGSLHLNMLMDAGPNQSVTIPIDYKKLYAGCAS